MRRDYLRLAIWTLVLTVLVSVQSVRSQTEEIENLVEIYQLNEMAPEFGTYTVEGYVAKIYECPECPEGAVCKPCMPPNIIISDRKSQFAQYALTDSELIVFADQAQVDELRVNKRYRFVIQVLDVKTTDQVLNNVKLIFAERM